MEQAHQTDGKGFGGPFQVDDIWINLFVRLPASSASNPAYWHAKIQKIIEKELSR